jgi:hypothetical protein
VFCAGHWDYPLEQRGLLFAPVRFPASAIGVAGFGYTPSIVVDVGGLEANLFACPRYSHYFFGDYYDNSYAAAGIFPCYQAGRLHTWYDPVYSYNRWSAGRNDPKWDARMRSDFEARQADKQLRPTRTYAQWEQRRAAIANLPEGQRRAMTMASPLNTIAADKANAARFAPVSATEQKQLAEHTAAAHAFRENRGQWESQTNRAVEAKPAEGMTPPSGQPRVLATPRMEGKGPAGVVESPPAHANSVTQAEKVKVPASPIAGKSAGRVEHAAPPTPAEESKHGK